MARPAGPPSDSVLLVEGQDDWHVVQHIWRHHAGEPPFCIVVKDSVEKLLAGIDGEIKVSDRQTVGILLDANTNPDGRWQAVKDRLAETGYYPSLPARQSPSGTIVEGRPRVGVWLMPDNATPGELENFVAQMIPNGDAVWPLSQAYIDGIPCAERKFSAKKKKRAQVHAWLAAREDPRLMGAAIGAGDLAVDGALCRAFVSWLKALFT